MAHHTVEWTLENEWVQGKLTCTAPEKAWCRMTCPETCVDFAYCEHVMVDNGKCLAVEWIENDTLEGSYRGPDTKPVDGPVEVSWSGDYWEWKYV